MKFDIVVAADPNWGIGKDNKLPWPSIKGDMAFFKKLTSSETTEYNNKAVIMGRKTWESIPEKFRPLPKRFNVVLTTQKEPVHNSVLQYDSFDHALYIVSKHTPAFESVYVIGGAKVYDQALKHSDLRYIFLTRVMREFECDTHLPDLDADWKREELLVEDYGDKIPYTIERLARK